jgi:hypothetical protein
VIELEAPEEGEFRIVDETLTYLTKEEYHSLPTLVPPKKEFVFVVSTKAEMDQAEENQKTTPNTTSTDSIKQEENVIKTLVNE